MDNSFLPRTPGKAMFSYAAWLLCCLVVLLSIIEVAENISVDCSDTANPNPQTTSVCYSNITEVCKDCIAYATIAAARNCPGAKQVTVTYADCRVTYSNVSAPAVQDAVPEYLDIDCPNTTLSTTSTYTANSTYESNLNALFSVLASNSNASNGFYNFTVGSSPPDVVYGLFICRGDLPTVNCIGCVAHAVNVVAKRCPWSKRVGIYYDECILRYSNQSIFSLPDTSFPLVLSAVQSPTNVTSFNEAVGTVMDDISLRASRADSGKKKFATGKLNDSSLQTVYGLAQCTPDLSQSDCYTCLRKGISILPSCCEATTGVRILYPSCYIRYETHPYFGTGNGPLPPPPPPALPPPPSSSTTTTPPSTTTTTTTTTSSPGKGGVSLQVVIAIVVSIGVSILLLVVAFCLMTRRAKKKYNFPKEACDEDDFLTLQSLHYDLGTIQAATKNFSVDNIIGEGGFALVYKGSLPDGQEVAVKRLSQSSCQGIQEFKKEVVLAAKLQHRNLVRLLGFCLEGEEKLLIHEFVPNKSLDFFLFDQQEKILDWSTCYKIIKGIARGMLYLHEDSQLRIIHRDLKASNILLDGEMNAKISDFGMSQVLRADQTQGSASEVVGTFGYMAPEYAMHGQFSTESDVFSFGVLILEIITGMKSNSFCQSDIAADLLNYAWKFWNDGAPLHLMDPRQKGPYSEDEVIKCIHIALLCVQEDPCARPSMAVVVAMLDGYFTTFSLPQQPAFHGWSGTTLQSDTSGSKPSVWSMNEVSTSELQPR